MSPPEDLDRLSHAELKGLVVKQWEQMVELQRMVAALRDEIARLSANRPDLLMVLDRPENPTAH